ncbi:MAG TPA: DUF885 domain-containing protein [Hyphomonadaceae bacterium]|nr:DUF885 domain-containing protein [Hyphomonadaceae bacterium]
MLQLDLKTSLGRAPVVAAMAGLALAGCNQPKPVSDPQLAALVQRIGQAEIARLPEEADMIGLSAEAFGRPYGALVDDRSMAVYERSMATRLDELRDLESIDRANLTRDARRTLDSALATFRSAAALDARGYGYVSLGWASPYVINQSDGAYTDLVKFLTRQSRVQSRADADNWLARLGMMAIAMRDERRRMEVDMEAGAAPPRPIIERTLAHVRELAPANPKEHILVTHFTEALAQIPDLSEGDIAKLTDSAARLVGGDISKEYKALIADLEKALPNAAAEPGVWRLKGGEQYYAQALKLYTTTDLTPQQLHEAGEKMVADLQQKIDAALLELGQENGSVGARLHALSVDPNNVFPDTPDGRTALLAMVADEVKWGETATGKLVTVGPKAKVEIREAPTVSQTTAPDAYYRAAPVNGSAPPTYNLNLASTLNFPKWQLPTLTFHESMPGHHLQAGLAHDRPNQTTLNYLITYPAFSEGWATYAEDLADEQGAYADDKLGKIGYYQSMLFRAARLVVDTGIHSERWTRDQAIAYLVDNTGMSRADMEKEVDRYTIWPGQACAYMAGRETIRRLRGDAQKELGQAFDLRAFHDAVLDPGPRPLSVLEADIQDWIASKRAPVAVTKPK